jgi:hypothetical protein
LTIVVSEIKLLDVSDGCQLQARIQSAAFADPFLLWYRFPSVLKRYLNVQNGNPFLAALLVVAMQTGEALEVAAPVSASLLKGANKIQELLRSWNGKLSQVEVRAPTQIVEPEQNRGNKGVGLFFSMGADSFYSLLKKMTHAEGIEGITQLIVIHGFDIYYGKWNTKMYAEVLKTANQVASKLNVGIIPVATNIRDLSDPIVDWGSLYFGSALASIGLALDNMLDAVYISGGLTYDLLTPWGSHPALDPLWSTESLKFIHDGCEANRIEKIRFISKFPIALNALRVCFMNPDDMYNCGQCEKCLRTMIALHIVGALTRCPTFPHKIDVRLLRKLPKLSAVSTPTEQSIRRASLRSYIEALGTSPEDLAIKTALQELMSS